MMPRVSLPIPLTIIKDPRELDGKSTAVHAVLLADAEMLGPDSCPEYDPSSTVLLFPGPDAVLPQAIDWSVISRILIIDGTWSQASSINSRSQHLGNLCRVTLPTTDRTVFWRYQHLGEHCLATIEAVHALYRSVFPDCCVDDLLWLYSFQYHLIQNSYHRDGRQFTSRHRPGYINNQSTTHC